jgi:hypothetical protein
MPARIILSVLAVVFLVAGLVRQAGAGERLGARVQARTWLTIATVFALVSAWLWYRL